MTPEHQALKAEGDALARTMAHHRMGQTNPTAHQLMQVGAWEQRCALAGVDWTMEALVERWIYAFNETMRKKMKEKLDDIWRGDVLGGVRSMGTVQGLVLRPEPDALFDFIDPFGPEVEISSYPQHISILPAERPELWMQQYGHGQRVGYSMAQLIASKPDRDDGQNRKQRRTQAAEKRGGRK